MCLPGAHLAGAQMRSWELVLLASRLPLTPALSPRERGKPGPVLEHSPTAGFVDRRTTIHPLLGERAGVRGNGTLEMQPVLKNGFAPSASVFNSAQALNSSV